MKKYTVKVFIDDRDMPYVKTFTGTAEECFDFLLKNQGYGNNFRGWEEVKED